MSLWTYDFKKTGLFFSLTAVKQILGKWELHLSSAHACPSSREFAYTLYRSSSGAKVADATVCQSADSPASFKSDV